MNDKINLLKKYNVDVDKGLEYTIDFETYNEILLDFYNSLDNELNTLENYKINNDLTNYGIKAHALKSNARTLGFNNMADHCYQHELAGKQNNINYINTYFNTLQQVIQNTKNIITEYKKI